jgi:hypothetical protein
VSEGEQVRLPQEAPIRTLTLSVVVVVAVVASLTLVRQQQVERRDERPAPGRTPASVDLEGIRNAGW